MTKVYVSSPVFGESSEIKIAPASEVFLHVGDKAYRIAIDQDNNLIFVLINGIDTRIMARGTYPAIKITNAYAVSFEEK